jgi:hypothetical protein
MTMTQKAVATARRNLAYRIGVHLDVIAEAARQPDPWELHYLVLALGHLKSATYDEGERAMMWGEMAPPSRAAQMVAELPAHEPQTMAELRALLETISSEGVEVGHDGPHRAA